MDEQLVTKRTNAPLHRTMLQDERKQPSRYKSVKYRAYLSILEYADQLSSRFEHDKALAKFAHAEKLLRKLDGDVSEELLVVQKKRRQAELRMERGMYLTDDSVTPFQLRFLVHDNSQSMIGFMTSDSFLMSEDLLCDTCLGVLACDPRVFPLTCRTFPCWRILGLVGHALAGYGRVWYHSEIAIVDCIVVRKPRQDVDVGGSLLKECVQVLEQRGNCVRRVLVVIPKSANNGLHQGTWSEFGLVELENRNELVELGYKDSTNYDALQWTRT